MATPLKVRDVYTRMKQRADIEKSGDGGLISDPEALNLIQLGTNNLHDVIVRTNELYIARYFNIITAPNQLEYPIPHDFFNLLSIGLVNKVGPAPDTWTPLYQWKMQNQNIPGNGFLFFTNGMYTIMQYRVIAGAIEFRSNQIVGIWYVPTAPQFKGLDDYLPPYFMPGWEEYLVSYAAQLIGAKEQNGVAMHEEIKKQVLAQIASFSMSRDSFRPETVTDCWMPQSAWPFGMMGSYGPGSNGF